MKSLVELRELGIKTPTDNFQGLWPAITQHRNTLETLMLRLKFESHQRHLFSLVFEVDTLDMFSIGFPKLTRLGYHVPFIVGRFEDGPCKRHIAFLEQLVRQLDLETLDLHILLPVWDTEYADLKYDAEFPQTQHHLRNSRSD
ncbi:hypothetical protein EJ04DRAFT_133290 [Polyplosphaeria fusca]|uniref:Uncharacterized protein n=1 Tax=Polyplosphaeria fusca TaxID=682080 RepID=A0A9P4UUW5_9PLEO|nr:hypothetical protein EJ04DRAFT_133290 [Polyplosphaeria fusca]